MDKSIYKVGIVSLILVIIFYLIAIIGKETLPVITIIALLFVFPLAIVSAFAFIAGYMTSGKTSGAVWSGIGFAVIVYIATEILAFPFKESKFVTKMKNFSNTNKGITAHLSNSVRGNIHWSIVWLIILAVIFALIGFALNEKRKKEKIKQ